MLFFCFQAEDGIRDKLVTGVQTVLFRSGAQNVVSVPLPAVIAPPSTDATNNPGQIQGSIRPQLAPVTPEEADRQMRSRVIPADLNRGFEHLDATRTGISALSATAPLASMSSIPELARALKNNPDLIYEFVHDKIEFYPIWGVQKGAFGLRAEPRVGVNPVAQERVVVGVVLEIQAHAVHV